MLKIHHNVIAHYFYKKAPPWMPDRILSKPLKATVLSLYKRPPQVILGKGVLKICSKFTGEHPCQSVISIKLQGNFDLRPAALLKRDSDMFSCEFCNILKKSFLQNSFLETEKVCSCMYLSKIFPANNLYNLGFGVCHVHTICQGQYRSNVFIICH